MTAVTQGAHGAVVNNLDGTVTYTPTGSYTGPDSFTYTVTDGNSNTATGTIDVMVGLAPASPVSAILDDLEDIEGELADPDENTVAAVTGAFAAVGGDIDTYLNDTTEYISTADIQVIGANLSASDFISAIIRAYKVGESRGLAARYAISNVFTQAVLDMVVAAKQFNEWVFAQLQAAMAANDIGEIKRFTSALRQANALHKNILAMYITVEQQNKKVFESAALAWLAANEALKAAGASESVRFVRIGDPPAPPVDANLLDLIPRRP